MTGRRTSTTASTRAWWSPGNSRSSPPATSPCWSPAGCRARAPPTRFGRSPSASPRSSARSPSSPTYGPTSKPKPKPEPRPRPKPKPPSRFSSGSGVSLGRLGGRGATGRAIGSVCALCKRGQIVGCCTVTDILTVLLNMSQIIDFVGRCRFRDLLIV